MSAPSNQTASPAVTGGGAPVEVVQVKGKRQLDEFIRLPWSIYEDDPNWIPPLISELAKHLDPNHQAYFEHAKVRFWLAYKDGRPVGRISAQIDELEPKQNARKIGHFGFLESEDDPQIFSALFEAAEGWLHEQGMERVIGPFNFSINQQEPGLLIDGFDEPPMILTGHAKPYYGGRVEQQGYAKAKDLYAYHLDVTLEFPAPVQRLLRRAEKQGRIRLRQIDMKRYWQDVADIRDIFNESWTENWGYVPVTDAESKQDGVAMKQFVRPEIVYIAEVDGELAGMMVTLPNLNEMIADLNGRLLPFGWAKLLWRMKMRWPKTARVMMMGVAKKFHGSLLGAEIAFMIIEAIRKNGVANGVKAAELSWILEDNMGMRQMLEAIESRLYKTYRLYSKDLV